MLSKTERSCLLGSREAGNTAPPAGQCGQRRERGCGGRGGKKLPARIRVLACGRFILRELSRPKTQRTSPYGGIKASRRRSFPHSHPSHYAPSDDSAGERGTKETWEKASVSLGCRVWPEGQSPTEETEWPFSHCPPMSSHPTPCT